MSLWATKSVAALRAEADTIGERSLKRNRGAGLIFFAYIGFDAGVRPAPQQAAAGVVLGEEVNPPAIQLFLMPAAAAAAPGALTLTRISPS